MRFFRHKKNKRIQKETVGIRKPVCCKNLVLFALVIAFLCTGSVLAQAQGGVDYEFAFAVHTINGNQYIRHVGPDAAKDTLGNNEYYAIYMTIHNNSGQSLNYSKAVLMIDKKAYSFGKKTIQSGHAASYYLDYEATKSITPGKHICTLKLDGKQVYSGSFKMPRNWGSVMTLPTAAQLRTAGRARSPYIGFYTQFSDNGGFTEYSIDLRMDYQPTHTYISPISWWMDTSALEKKYAKVWADYGGTGGGYCGFQVWDDGTTAVIMTLWDVFCQDKSGNVKQVKAKVLYPENAKETDFSNSSEGSFVHYLYPFKWEAGKDYRLLLQQSAGDNGNVLLTLWLKDLDKGSWTELYCFDAGLQDVWISSAAGFVENPNPKVSAYPRALEFWNVRARMKRSGKWVNAKSITFSVNASVGQMDYEGSYNFGRDDANCWIITSGITGLCTPNKNKGPYKVPSTESGQPY